MSSVYRHPEGRNALLHWVSRGSGRSTLSGYLIAVLAVGLAIVIRASLWPVLHSKAPFLVFVLAVLGTALYGGFRTGLLATGLAVVAIDYIFLDPRFEFTQRSASDYGALALFAAVAVATSTVVDRLDRALRAEKAQRSERRRAELEVIELAQRLKLEVENSPLAVIEFDSEFAIRGWTGEAERIFGWNAEEVVGKRIDELRWIHEEDAAKLHALNAEKSAGASSRNVQLSRNYRKDGTIIDCEWYNSALLDASGQPKSILSLVLDVSERKRSEEAVRQSEERLQAIMDGAPGIVTVKDSAGRFITINRTLERLLGMTREELKGKTDYDIFPKERADDYREHDRRVFESGRLEQLEEVADLADGHHVFLTNKFPLHDANGNVYAVCGISLDITDRKQDEERLRQAQKLESLGLLAGGVAHDFNNLLVGVIGNASLAQDMLAPNDPAAELLQRVIKAGEQAAHLTRQMLAYSGRGRFQVEPLDLSDFLPESTSLLQASIPKNIALRLGLGQDLPLVEADRGQIQQVFMNLVLNAAEAIGSKAGLISVGTGVQDVDAGYVRKHPGAADLSPGRYVYLEVRDTGCGMDDAVKARIFDPFFSTKFTGRGLGLAAVAGIVRGHHGAIHVSSAPGKGSCFTVLFPAGDVAAAVSPIKASDATPRGTGTVLVVDDEMVVRQMAKKALERDGFTVLEADGGESAIRAMKVHRGDISLVILDLSMPRMGGDELLPQLRRIRPEVRVMVSSGYSEAETLNMFRGQHVSGFIQKPYTSTQLQQKVKSTIDSSEAAALSVTAGLA